MKIEQELEAHLKESEEDRSSENQLIENVSSVQNLSISEQVKKRTSGKSTRGASSGGGKNDNLTKQKIFKTLTEVRSSSRDS